MSESNNISFPYAVLDDRPIDQWKVTELKEELKRRNLMTKGLKEDLVRRLDEAVRSESDEAKMNGDNGSYGVSHIDLQSEDATNFLTSDLLHDGDSRDDIVNDDFITAKLDGENDDTGMKMDSDKVQIDDELGVLTKQSDLEGEFIGDTLSMRSDGLQVGQELLLDASSMGSETLVSEITYKSQDLQNIEKHEVASESQELQNSEKQETACEGQELQNSEKHEIAGRVQEVKNNENHEIACESRELQNNEYHGIACESQELQNSENHEIACENQELQTVEKHEMACKSLELQNIEMQNKDDDVSSKMEEGDLRASCEGVQIKSFDLSCQVVEVSDVKCSSIFVDTNSITESTEKNDLSDNVFADDVKLEADGKPVMVEPPSSIVVLDDVKLQSFNVIEPHQDKLTGLGENVNIEDANLGREIDVEVLGSSEKLNLDQSPRDDSMEDDTLEIKQIDCNFDEVGHVNEKVEISVKECIVDDVIDTVPTEKKIEDSVPADFSLKRKVQESITVPESARNSKVRKRLRRWNNEGLKVPEPRGTNYSASSTPKDVSSSALKRNVSRSVSAASEDLPKERVVPPSSEPPTNSLRIDRFLRPFTLNAVQDLLGKTGTLTNFWMDHIKTHCYVTYSSVEEAVATRNAVYNLQWPANGGHLLVAEFVDPQDVKVRVEPPPQPLPAPVSTTNTTLIAPVTVQPPQLTPRQQAQRQKLFPPTTIHPLQPSPRLHVQRQQLPLPSHPPPPPPPSSNPPLVSEQHLPPPPPLEKIGPPVVTLDDLFKKTKATPCIYYSPLTDEQVAEKLNVLGENSKH